MKKPGARPGVVGGGLRWLRLSLSYAFTFPQDAQLPPQFLKVDVGLSDEIPFVVGIETPQLLEPARLVSADVTGQVRLLCLP